MTVHPRDNFEDTDTICLTCLIDEHLRQLAQPRSRPAECCVCESTDNPSIQIGDLAEIVDTKLRQYFGWGKEVRKFAGENDDSGWTERRGYEMSELLDIVLPAHFPIPSTLQRALGDRDAAPRDGGEPFWSEDMRYQEESPTLEDERAEWDRVASELKFHRRFFNRRAEQFFSWLFDGLEELTAPEGPVVFDVPSGSPLFRARRCDPWGDVQRIGTDPAKELGPPPPTIAAENRMSAKGVPFFYGAVEQNTCIAELRAPLGGQVAVAQFTLTRNAKVLDFRRLASARSKTRPSIFRDDYAREIARRHFTTKVHELIRAPVLPGRESEYLITQVMAEYLAHVREPHFDALLFSSAQEKGGTNIVLFGPTSMICYVPGSVTFHQITYVKYESKQMQLVNVQGKPGFLFDPMAIFDDER